MELGQIKGIGVKLKKDLEKINIFTINDLLEYYPYKYNYINICSINEDRDNYIIKGKVIENPKVYYIKNNLNKMIFRFITENKLINVTIFNRAFLKQSIIVNKDILLIGKYNKLNNSFIASDIKFDIINKIEPVYHSKGNIKNNIISKVIKNATECYDIVDNLPKEYIDKYNLIDKKTAISYIHNPKNKNELKKAFIRLVYEELFDFTFKINYLKINNKNSIGIKRDITDISELLSNLSFSLTSCQLSAINDIINDLKSPYRMKRIVLGDVGSGKTIVAIAAMYMNYLNKYQSVMMVPTEVLAIQHYNTINNLLGQFGIKTILLTGKIKKSEKNKLYNMIQNNEVDIIVGTHSLFNDEINYNNLGLVITDEQHRFGVNHRNKMQNKGINPDILYLSATPIPRTYAHALYGELDISNIKTKPSNRKEVITYLKKENEIKDILYLIYNEIKNNNQVYVVSPLISDNDDTNLLSAETLYNKFKLAFKNINIGILHSKLSSEEKDNILDEFKNGNIKILISTTVIEVGIDVKNASVIVIFNAERFGLATLHQLRGRVGRGDKQGYAILVSDYETERLNVLCESNDGFYISEMDFKLRGSGDIFGLKQSGYEQFKLASIERDSKLLFKAMEDSEYYIVNNLYKNNKYYLDIINNLEKIM